MYGLSLTLRSIFISLLFRIYRSISLDDYIWISSEVVVDLRLASSRSFRVKRIYHNGYSTLLVTKKSIIKTRIYLHLMVIFSPQFSHRNLVTRNLQRFCCFLGISARCLWISFVSFSCLRTVYMLFIVFIRCLRSGQRLTSIETFLSLLFGWVAFAQLSSLCIQTSLRSSLLTCACKKGFTYFFSACDYMNLNYSYYLHCLPFILPCVTNILRLLILSQLSTYSDKH